MKRLLTYVLAGGLLIVAALTVYIYQEYMGEDTDPATDNPPNSIIHKRLNAVVLRITATKADNLPKINVAYSDLDTQEASSFLLNNQYQQRIHIGDTLTKDKGEKMLLVLHKTGGKLEMLPID